jgi:DMSO reductase anchor subunit
MRGISWLAAKTGQLLKKDFAPWSKYTRWYPKYCDLVPPCLQQLSECFAQHTCQEPERAVEMSHVGRQNLAQRSLNSLEPCAVCTWCVCVCGVACFAETRDLDSQTCSLLGGYVPEERALINICSASA